MRNTLDFSSWWAVLSTLGGLVLVSLIAVGIRLLVMHGVQQRRERQNRQINERLKTLIAAYKVLGGSFTGDLAVDPRHLRDLRKAAAAGNDEGSEQRDEGSDRRRRIRDAVEAALSDVILLGTREQVALAARAANDMVAGRTVELAELVMSLRAFIRDVLDLETLPSDLMIPRQGPVRSAGSAARGTRGGANSANGSGNAGAGGGGRAGGGQGGGAMAAGGGGLALGLGAEAADAVDPSDPHPGR